jgi:Flp pilus assembly protein TadG
MVFPFFMIILFGVIEFAFALNGALSVDFATREAALAAAEAGAEPGADCSVLAVIDKSVSAPADDSRITEVRIYKSDPNGKAVSAATENVYARVGTPNCPGLPYHLVKNGYPDTSRCVTLAGCGTGSSKTVTVDTIGVQMTYIYDWKTPLPRLLPMSGPGFTVTMNNAMRMEPVL